MVNMATKFGFISRPAIFLEIPRYIWWHDVAEVCYAIHINEELSPSHHNERQVNVTEEKKIRGVRNQGHKVRWCRKKGKTTEYLSVI